MKMNKKIIAIDPGSTGAMVFTDADSDKNVFWSRVVSCDRANICEIQKAVSILGNNIVAFVEDVGKHMVGNSAGSSIKLARNHQNIITTLYMLGIETVSVTPQKWTKELGVQIKDERSKEEKSRVRSLGKNDRDKENARNRKAKKDKKTEKVYALIKERWGDIDVPKYAVDAHGIYLFAEKELSSGY